MAGMGWEGQVDVPGSQVGTVGKKMAVSGTTRLGVDLGGRSNTSRPEMLAMMHDGLCKKRLRLDWNGHCRAKLGGRG